MRSKRAVAVLNSFRMVNRSLCELLGYEEAWFLARRIRDMVHPDDLEEALQERTRLITGPSDKSATKLRPVRADGATVWVRRVGALFGDLDNFRVVNESLGHGAGDEVLAIVADRIVAALQPGDRVGRFGGDEFVIVVHDLQDGLAVEHCAERVSASIAADLQVRGHRIVPTASMSPRRPDSSSPSAPRSWTRSVPCWPPARTCPVRSASTSRRSSWLRRVGSEACAKLSRDTGSTPLGS